MSPRIAGLSGAGLRPEEDDRQAVERLVRRLRDHHVDHPPLGVGADPLRDPIAEVVSLLSHGHRKYLRAVDLLAPLFPHPDCWRRHEPVNVAGFVPPEKPMIRQEKPPWKGVVNDPGGRVDPSASID
jgi:hypothetical protein